MVCDVSLDLEFSDTFAILPRLVAIFLETYHYIVEATKEFGRFDCCYTWFLRNSGDKGLSHPVFVHYILPTVYIIQ